MRWGTKLTSKWPQTAVMLLDLRKSNNHTVWAKIALFFLAVLRFDSKIFFFLPSCQARTCIKDLLELKDLHVVTEVCSAHGYLFKKFTAEIKSKIAASEKHTSQKQHHDHRDRTNPSNVGEKNNIRSLYGL